MSNSIVKAFDFSGLVHFSDRLPTEIENNVSRAIAEDFGDGDLTATLIPEQAPGTAGVITREAGILCGTPWFDYCMRHFDPEIKIVWHALDQDLLTPGQRLCTLHGKARALLSAERTSLNFLQLLSGVATRTFAFVQAVEGTRAQIVDTRKTIPGLRLAQKYAVRCGGGENHRIALYDGILIKENHIIAAGSIEQALAEADMVAHQAGQGCRFVQIEVEGLDDLNRALAAGAKMVLLDNFTLPMLREAVAVNAGRAILEASGGISLQSVREIAETGVDRISVGELTKDVRPLDLSMRFE